MSRFLDEHDLANQLETDVDAIVALIEHGAIPARKDNDGGWLIRQRDVNKFRTEWGTRVEDALAHFEAEQGPYFGSTRASSFFVSISQGVAWFIMLVGGIGAVINVLNGNITGLIASAAILIAGIGYHVLYDVVLSVFAMRRSLEQIASELTAMRSEDRRKSA